MAKPEQHYGTKEHGKVRAASFRAAIDALPDGPIVLTVAADGNAKSTPQNNYLHLLFRIAAKYMNDEGYGDGSPWTMERVKAHCKAEGVYPMTDVVLPTGEIKQVAKDTAELDKLETMETIERVIAYFAELGITLPQPDEQTEIQL